ncbi:hypothetical protein GCM10010326_66340 [Streptomyces xanthochromogenes]|uniref:Uncharacterized protein n=1 Tax=Streptomyces xanthochromogenes TaxID=67384 RepID=A0ABQ3ANJ2_9ACTN|nr:hypothetical protein GCM10010326_66340 [Streptomyces xanthochromogenes]
MSILLAASMVDRSDSTSSGDSGAKHPAAPASSLARSPASGAGGAPVHCRTGQTRRRSTRCRTGGAPNHPRNLWVEPPSSNHQAGAGPNNPKDSDESKLHTAVCSGKVQLAAARDAIATDWTTALATLGLT